MGVKWKGSRARVAPDPHDKEQESEAVVRRRIDEALEIVCARYDELRIRTSDKGYQMIGIDDRRGVVRRDKPRDTIVAAVRAMLEGEKTE